MDLALTDMLTTTIQVASRQAASTYGDTLYDVPRTAAARVEYDSRLVTTGQGEDVTTNWVVYTLEPVLLSDRVFLSTDIDTDTDQNMGREVRAVSPITDEDGSIHHYEVLL